MVQKNHTVSIVVEGTTLDLNGQDELNLRINSVLYDPTKILSTSGEYSFSFDLPMTPSNCKVFDYANVASKTNKFNKLWNTEVYADGHLVFQGQIKIASIEDGQFKANLINVKAGSLQDIFGEDTMNQVEWKIDYDGFKTINKHNADDTSDIMFPLVSYGPFVKTPYTTYYNEYNAYTSKFLLDQYVQWYDSTFPPSARLLELVKRMFERKGYAVAGNIFSDNRLQDIFLSTHLGNDQVPTYNLGNPNIGKLNMAFSFRNGQYFTNGVNWNTYAITPLIQTLNFPYDRVSPRDDTYLFDEILVYDIFSAIKTFGNYHYDPSTSPRPEGVEDTYAHINSGADGGMWRENCIVIPQSGVYKINLNVNMTLEMEDVPCLGYNPTTQDYDTLAQLKKEWSARPIEIQLLRNSDETELIHGYITGSEDDRYNLPSIYPHEAPPSTTKRYQRGGSSSGTSTGSGSSGNRNTGNSTGARRTVGTRGESSGGVTDSNIPGSRGEADGYGDPTNYNIGMMPKQGDMVAYDPYVNENFICGITSISDSPSVLKNGYSWNPEYTQRNQTRFNCEGYYGVKYGEDYYTMVWDRTTYNSNTYPGAPVNRVTTSGNTKSGTVSCVVWLNAGDILLLKAVLRSFVSASGTGGTYYPEPWYRCLITGNLDIEAYSPKEGDVMSQDLRYTSPSKFPDKLNVGEFLPDNMKQSDFIQNFINSFNLDFHTEGNTAIFEKNKINFDQLAVPVELDDRVNTDTLTIEPIGYPRSMEIKYTINDTEYGFYQSVVAAGDGHINDDDWKDWAYTGSSPVQLNNDEDSEDESKTLTTSYTWYGDFSLPSGMKISMPVISKDEWMIDSYKDEESMLADGFSLPQRLFYRGAYRTDITFTDIHGNEFHPRLVVNSKDGLNLNYEPSQTSLLTEYFNITPFVSSDMITAEVYLSAEEYSLLKLGAPVRINSDIYYVCSITGYDPTGNNPAQIKAMKKG